MDMFEHQFEEQKVKSSGAQKIKLITRGTVDTPLASGYTING